MQTLKHQLTSLFEQGFKAAFPEASAQVDITAATQAQFGHYQCNSAMRLAKQLKMAPREISAAVINAIKTNEDNALVDRFEVAGPGFINIWLSVSALSQYCDEMFKGGLQFDLEGEKQRVVVDFSSPNIAKEMHVGHLRSTIIGDSLCRLFEYLGHDVLRLNHLGDWGTAFGMLIAYIKQVVGVQTLDDSITLSNLVGWYKASKAKFDEDSVFKKDAQEEVVKLQGGDQTNYKLWAMIVEISEKAYREVYGLLDVKITDRGESFYNAMLPGIIEDLEAKRLIELSDGAKCVYLEGYTNREGEPLPFMVQKTDGGFNYSTTDLAAIKQRVEVEKGTRLIYVTDSGQGTHFKMLFEVAQKAGFVDPQSVRCDHVPFGVVLGPDGKKFKTRSGETEKLIDLLNNAVIKAKEILIERNTTQQTPFTEEEMSHLALVLGIGAVKYADLSCNRTNDYTFSYDRMLKFEGNTASFLLYSYVRICGIKRKIGALDFNFDSIEITLKEEAEVDLGLHLSRWQESLIQISEDLMPNRLCDYLYELANKFNAFFRDCRVEGVPEQNQRLKLCELTATVLAAGLTILGLQTTERM